jgi:hypothetical protein
MSPPTSVDEAQSQERRGVMSISTPVPATTQLRRGRLVGLIAVVAALAAAVTSALLVLAVGSRSEQADPSRETSAGIELAQPSPVTSAADAICSPILEELEYRGSP